LLTELDLSYVLDWTSDDQPYPLNEPGMLSVPYTVELNDLGIFTGNGLTGPEFVQMFTDHLDQLYADSAHSGRVMALCASPVRHRPTVPPQVPRPGARVRREPRRHMAHHQ
jgi:allantoinase